MSLILLLLLTAFPLLAPLVSSVVLWRRVNHALLFLVVSVCCLFTIGEISYGQLISLLVPALPHPLPHNSLALATAIADKSILAMAMSDVLVLLFGAPLIAWLFSAFRKSPCSSEPKAGPAAWSAESAEKTDQ